MGISCKPIGKIGGIHRKLENKQVKAASEERQSNKKSKSK